MTASDQHQPTIPQMNGEGITRASLDLLYHVSREFAAALDLRTVLERVLFLSMQSVGAMSGSIIVLDDSGKPVELAMITGAKTLDHTTQRLRDTVDRGLAGWVLRNRQGALVTDTSQDERWMTRHYADEESNAKSAVCAPICVRDAVVGVMTLAHDLPGFYTLEHLNLVQAIADQAGVAIINARLYAESQRQARVMTALAESAAAISASLNLENVLMRILEQTSQALQVQAVSIALLDPQKGDLVFRAATGWEKATVSGVRLRLGQGFAGWVASEGSGLVAADARRDSRFDEEITRRTGLDVQSVTCAPVRLRGAVIGVLEAINPLDNPFDGDSQLMLTGIGSLAGSAIRHAQLFERLQAAHQRYRELFDDSIDPIFLTDWSGRILEANRRALATVDGGNDPLLGLLISSLHTIDAAKLGEGLNLHDGSTISYESVLKTNGSTIPIQVYVRQVQIEDSSHLQWIFRDITERKSADSLRSDLLAMVYHDIRSPLANVVSSLDTLSAMLPPEDEQSLGSLVTIAMRSTDRIQRLTNSLLDINRLEEGQQIGNWQAADLASLANEGSQVVLPNAQHKNQALETGLPADLPEIYCDPDMIRRVLINLLENAVKYTGAGGKLSIGAQSENDDVRLWVQDTGPGIPASEHTRIFEKFTRLPNQAASKGLGLGLTFCRLAVQGHGGRIWVESEPGQGSKFIFTLPVDKNKHLSEKA